MIYALLILFFFLEYVRPTSYVPALTVLSLNSLVPLTAFVASVLTAGPATFTRIFSETNTKLVLTILGLVWLSALTADVQQRAWDAFMILLGYVFAYWIIASQVTSVARVRGVIKALIVVHLVVAALNPSLLTDPGTRHYITSGGFLGDGNDFALSLDIIVPLCLFLVLNSGKIVQRTFWSGALLVLIAGVVGTQSRGGTLGLVAAGIYYWAKGTKKMVSGAIAVIALALVLVLAPGSYFERMSTMGDTTEGSAAGRITAWTAAVRMAVDNPLLGVGAAHFGVKIGTEYRPPGFVGSGMTAHSVYFLALGELGFPGLIVVIWLIVSNIAANRRLSLSIQKRQYPGRASDVQLLGSMSAALIAFTTAGAFLSALYYPHLYVISGLMIATRHVVSERAKTASAGAVAAAAKPVPALHWALQKRKPAWHAPQLGARR